MATLQAETVSKEEMTQAHAAIRIEIEELLKKFEDEKKKSDQYQESIQKLEEKVSNMESEIQVLRQQALVMSPTRQISSTRPKTTIIPLQRTPDNGALDDGVTRKLALAPIPYMRELETEESPQTYLNEEQQKNQDLLMKSISQDLGFSEGKPVAACLIYKCLLQWRLFEVERTTIFDRILQTVAGAIESQDNSDVLSYWLSNSATLLLLLQRTLKAGGAASLTPQRRSTSSASILGHVSQGLRGSPQSVGGFSFFSSQPLGGLDELRQVEAKYPALLFEQQLTAFLEKIYGLIRDNLKKEISPVLGQCIQAPRTSRGGLANGRSQANAVAQQALIPHWQNIVKTLNSHLNTMRANHVPSFLVHKVFTQTFSFINIQLFNSFLLRRECCSFSNGEYVKSGLSELELWCREATDEYAGSAWEELKHVRQAVGFLVTHEKPEKPLREITNVLCPVLSIQQLYRISTMYWDDKYGTLSVSADVIQSMRVMMTEESGNPVSTSFLLDDDLSIPFTVDDIAKSVEPMEIVEVDPPPLLRQNSSFAFLQQ